MFCCSSGGSDPLNMSKSDILRGIITEKLSTAAREILAVVERTVADYEQEASGFRREIDRQRRQLELLQPEVRLSRGDVEAAESHRLTGNQCDGGEGPVSTRLTGNQCDGGEGPVSTRLTGNQCDGGEGPVSTRLTGNQCDGGEGPVSTRLTQQDPDPGKPPRSGFSRVQTARRRRRTVQTRVGGSQNQLKNPQVKMEAGQRLPSDPVVLESHGTGLHGTGLHDREADRRHTVAVETQVRWNEVVKVEVKQEEGSVAQLRLGPTGADQSGLRTSSAEGESDPGGDALSVGSTSEPDDPESDDDSSDSSSDSDESLAAESVVDVEPKATRRKTDKLTCRVCGSWYRQLGSLISHIWNHVNEPHGVCGVCGDAFESAEALKQHLPSHKKGYSCWICGKYLLSSVTLNRHVANHLTDAGAAPTRVRCSLCSKTFSTPAALNAHSRVHLDGRAAGRRLCPKASDAKSGLASGGGGGSSLGHSCHLCGTTFALETSLKTHEKTHSAAGGSPFAGCKAFRTRQSQAHGGGAKAHGGGGEAHGGGGEAHGGGGEAHGGGGGGSPFACGLCDMSFLSEETLRVHMVVHSGETPYRCAHCGRGFRRPAHLANHVRTHPAAQQGATAGDGQTPPGHGLQLHPWPDSKPGDQRPAHAAGKHSQWKLSMDP